MLFAIACLMSVIACLVLLAVACLLLLLLRQHVCSLVALHTASHTSNTLASTISLHPLHDTHFASDRTRLLAKVACEVIPASCQELNAKPHGFTEGQIIDLTNLMESAHGLLLDQADQMERSYAEVTGI